MRFPKRMDLSEFLPADQSGNQPSTIYTLYGVTVHTGTVQSGHYYVFLRPFMEDDDSEGLLHWIRFDDETITKVSDFAAMEDNYGGEDLTVFDNTKMTPEEYKRRMANDEWPRETRMRNSYVLSYIREDMISVLFNSGRRGSWIAGSRSWIRIDFSTVNDPST